MGRELGLLLGFFSISIGLVAADWNILNYIAKRDVGSSLKNYCESWRLNVELNNIREFDAVPGECVEYIGKYMMSTQYKVDVQRAVEECGLYLSNSFVLGSDGKDAWIFDIDDTLLSTVPYYKKHHFGGAKTNKSSLERWMEEANAPAIVHALNLSDGIKARGLKILIISSRGEHLRDATVDNLVKVGYHGWTQLILRCAEDTTEGVKAYKAEQRRKLISQGYRMWGILGDQWSNFLGLPGAKRTFKLPNSMYYDS